MKLTNSHIKIVSQTIERTRHKHSYFRTNHSKMHYAFLFSNNNLLCFGTNYNTGPVNELNIKQGNIHAELDCIKNIYYPKYSWKNAIMVNVRINKHGEFKMSAPCKNCQELLNKFHLLDRLYFTTEKGEFVKYV